VAYAIPDARELIDRNLANIEQNLNEKSPPAEKSFNRVWATVEGLSMSGLYAFAADRVRDNLAISASEAGLETLGEEYDLPRRGAIPWRGKAAIPLTHGQTLYAGTVYIGGQGLKYETLQNVTGGPDNTAAVTLQCADSGPAGNLSAGDSLAIQSVVDGAGRTATVAEVTRLGLDIENIEDYRVRILDVIRGGSGGSGAADESGAVDVQVDACVTASDYRIAAEAVGGVARAYPFSGPPENSGLVPMPGQRTVYIEASPDIDPDGIPPQPLLDLVRAAFLADPVTGNSREILGVPTGPELLFVRPIRRTGIYVRVIGLSVISSSLAEAESRITEAVRTLLKSYAPFVQGLDADFDRREELTASVLAREIQTVLDAYGGSAEYITFGDTDTAVYPRYVLSEDEKLRLEEIEFEEAS
jgi:uncharacterized phage protein gp47/JayE